jgi:hypothetical protein
MRTTLTVLAAATLLGLAILGGSAILGASIVEAHPVSWKKCPLPIGADYDLISEEMQYRAWEKAKELSEVTGLEDWDLPCYALRFHSTFKGDPDGPGGLPNGTYLGLWRPPEIMLNHDDGIFYMCEYITIHLPDDREGEVFEILTHEYLHAIFLRLWWVFPEFREAWPDPSIHSEWWVRMKTNDTDWLEEHSDEEGTCDSDSDAVPSP